jgi:hypothetical protein
MAAGPLLSAPDGSLLKRARASVDLRSSMPTRWQLALAAIVIAVLMGPMVLTGSTFGGDWPTHLWLVQMQARNIQALGHPSLFVQSSIGAFEPWYAFYGGTLYSLTALGAILSGGHTLAVYILSFALAMAMAYGGFLWIARQCGLGGFSAHIPALLFLTSSYYLSDIFSRGAWPETVAISSIPLVVASGLALLRAPSWRLGPVMALVVSVVVLTGSHNITLLYGTVFLALLCVTVAIAVGREALPPTRRVLAVVGLGLIATAVNLWFLLPDVAFEGKITIGHSFTTIPSVTGGMPVSLLLDPIRHSQTPNYSTLDLQIPTLALVWALATMGLCWRSLPSVWRRLAVALTITGLPFLAVACVPALWHAVPHLFWSIQFPYRLLSYIDTCVVGLVMIALIALLAQRRKGAGRRAMTALVLVGVVFAVVEGAQAIVEGWNTPSSLHSRSEAFPGGSKAPSFWTKYVTYLQDQDVSEPVIASTTINEIPGLTFYNGEGANVIAVPVRESPKSGYAVSFVPPKSGTIGTDVISGPYLVAVHGAKWVGRFPYSELILAVKKNPNGTPTRVTFSTATTWPIVVGKWATLVALLLLSVLLLALTVHAAPWRRDNWPAFPRPRPPN